MILTIEIFINFWTLLMCIIILYLYTDDLRSSILRSSSRPHKNILYSFELNVVWLQCVIVSFIYQFIMMIKLHELLNDIGTTNTLNHSKWSGASYNASLFQVFFFLIFQIYFFHSFLSFLNCVHDSNAFLFYFNITPVRNFFCC